MSRAVAAVSALALLGGAATTPVLDEAASALRNDPVYVDADAERRIDDSSADELREAIGGAGTPVYLAILPDSARNVAGGDPSEVAGMLAQAVDRPGSFVVVVGDAVRAGSTELPAGRAGELADAALESSEDTATVLLDLVERIGDAVTANETEGQSPAGVERAGTGTTQGDDDDGGSGTVLLVLLAVGVGAAGLIWWWMSKRRREQEAERARAEEADRQMLRAEISVIADDVVRYQTEVQVHPEAQGDYDAAVNRYRAAQAALDQADEPIDLVRVARVVAEARYSMDRARAIVDGREPPPPPAELQRPGQHGEPAITLDERREPAYVGYPGGYAGGWYGGMGGMFGGLLLGSMLAGGFGHWGYGGGTTIINEGGDGGGDFGGGDFGGGDFGGGDFGGGDFGGGDF